MIGSGIGSLLSINKKLKINLSFISLLQGVSVVITSIILLRLDLILHISSNLIFIGLILSSAFILFGYLVTLILTQIMNEVPVAIRFIYSSDLVGAALGGIVTIFIILPYIGTNKASILCVVLYFISAVLFRFVEKKNRNSIYYTAISILALSLFCNLDPRIEKYRNIKNTQLYGLLKDGGELLYSGWSQLHRIDIVNTGSNLTVAYNGFLWTSFEKMPDSVNIQSMLNVLGPRFMKGLYPFMHRPEKILIIGAGAGPDLFYSKVVMDEWFKNGIVSKGKIVGVEIDPSVVNLMSNKFKDFNNNIFNKPGVYTVIDDGRHFLETSSEEYDLIHYPGVDTPFAYTNVLGVNPYLRAENYLYTFEGLNAAFKRLSENGALIITVGSWFSNTVENFDSKKIFSHMPREARLIATLKLILEKNGIKEWDKYIEVIAYVYPHGSHNSMLDSMIKISKRPIDQQLVKQTLDKYNIRQPVYFIDKSDIVKLSRLHSPATDNQPFYYNFPLADIPKMIYQPLIFFFILLISYLIFVSVFIGIKNRVSPFSTYSAILIFFTFCGISLMAAELFYAQQSIILLGNSFLGSSILIPLFLLFSGVGSISADKIIRNKNQMFFIFILLPVYNFLLPHFINVIRPHTLYYSIYLKTILFSIILFPIGYMLGVFFPAGLLLSNRLKTKIGISWLYSMDILGSIVGIFIGICLPIKIGYSKSISYLSYLLFIQVILFFWVTTIIYKRSR
jgi:predicted membrane-bound spermidine synthase